MKDKHKGILYIIIAIILVTAIAFTPLGKFLAVVISGAIVCTAIMALFSGVQLIKGSK